MSLPIVEMSYPTRVVFGPGAIRRVPEQLARLGMKRPLVVTDPGVVRAGLAAKLLEVIEGAKLSHQLFDSVRPNPTEDDAFFGVKAYRLGGCDGVVAIGGGSPLDTAKLIALLVVHPPPLSQYDDAIDGSKRVIHPMPPSIAIPTTAGTGSEVSRSAVALLKDTRRKTVIFAPQLMPGAAVCDPELTLGLPPAPTAATGLDAFTHCVEAYCARGFHPLADAVAIDGVGRVARSLVTAVREGRDLAARSEMMVAAIQGAMAFQKGLGACHALAHALGAIANVHHGLANAVCLPAVLEYNLEAATPRLARIAVAMGEPDTAREEQLAGAAIEKVRRLCREAGVPSSLRAIGVSEQMLSAIANKAYEDASHLANPRRVGRDDLLKIATAAL